MGALVSVCVCSCMCVCVCIQSWHCLMVCKRKPDVGVARETEQHEARSAGAVPCVRLLEPPTSVQRRRRAESTLGFGAFRKLVKVELAGIHSKW